MRGNIFHHVRLCSFFYVVAVLHLDLFTGSINYIYLQRLGSFKTNGLKVMWF